LEGKSVNTIAESVEAGFGSGGGRAAGGEGLMAGGQHGLVPLFRQAFIGDGSVRAQDGDRREIGLGGDLAQLAIFMLAGLGGVVVPVRRRQNADHAEQIEDQAA
jgi:hypothetical protein